MNTVKNYSISKDYNNVIVNLYHNNNYHSLITKSGLSDRIKIFKENNNYYILSINHPLNYIGIEEWHYNIINSKLERIKEFFSSNPDEEIKSKRSIWDYSDLYKAKIIIEYLNY